MKSVEIVLCIVLGVIFLISSVPKLRYPKGFILTVLEYRVLPPSMGRLYGRVLPPLEFLLALLLLTGTVIYLAAILTALLLLSFMIAMSINIARGRDMDCHCFGTKVRRRTGWPLVLQDSLLMGATVVVTLLTSAHTMLESWSIFRIIDPGSSTSFLALLASVGLTGSSMFVLRFFQSRGRESRFSRARSLSK